LNAVRGVREQNADAEFVLLVDLREAVRLEPDDPAVRLNLGACLLAADQPTEAYAHLAAAAEAGLTGAAVLRE
jgi:predicted Zn-dependent protease